MLANLRDPSFIAALVYFERVADRLSFTQAAADLGVTPSAVSHRISSLEATIGARLLRRSPKAVSLTNEGVELLAAAADAFGGLRKAVDAIAGRRILRVAIGAYISVNWLMPRLTAFEASHTDVRVDLIHMKGWPNMKEFDVAIAWVKNPPPDANAELLFDSACIPVVSPSLAVNGPISASKLPLLHYRTREVWRDWLQLTGGPEHHADSGEIFEDPILLLEAAAHGRGVGMGFLPFVDEQISSGRLVRASDHSVRTRQKYWLVKAPSMDPKLRDAFADWALNHAQVGERATEKSQRPT